jgi:cephalosporin hydroxylase
MKTIYIDSTNHITELCKLGEKYGADKSPLTTTAKYCAYHRKGYTAFYEMIFSSLKNKPINFCEIGIAHGASLQMFFNYFSDVNIVGLELHDENIKICSDLNIPKTNLIKTNAEDECVLNASFASARKEFDIIIDDASHLKEHQINTLKIAPKYLKSGGILIIEDLYRNDLENVFDNVDLSMFSFYTFVICHHENRECWDNDKIWYGVKK